MDKIIFKSITNEICKMKYASKDIVEKNYFTGQVERKNYLKKHLKNLR